MRRLHEWPSRAETSRVPFPCSARRHPSDFARTSPHGLRIRHQGTGPPPRRAVRLPAHPERQHAARQRGRLPARRRLVDGRVPSPRVSRGDAARGQGASDRVGREPAGAGQAHRAGVRALRRAAPRSARRVGHAGVRADHPERQPLRPRRGGRQGPGVLHPEGLRGGARRQGPAAAQRELHHRGRGGVRRRRDLRPPRQGAGADQGGRGAGGRHGLLRPGNSGRVHGASRHVLRRDPPPDAGARPPLRHLRRRGARTPSRRCAACWWTSRGWTAASTFAGCTTR